MQDIEYYDDNDYNVEGDSVASNRSEALDPGEEYWVVIGEAAWCMQMWVRQSSDWCMHARDQQCRMHMKQCTRPSSPNDASPPALPPPFADDHLRADGLRAP